MPRKKSTAPKRAKKAATKPRARKKSGLPVTYDYDSDEYKTMLALEVKEINRKIMAILNEAGAKWELDLEKYPAQSAATMYTMISMDAVVGILGLAAILYPDPIQFFKDTMPLVSDQTIVMFEHTYKSFALAMAAKYAMPIAGDATKVH